MMEGIALREGGQWEKSFPQLYCSMFYVMKPTGAIYQCSSVSSVEYRIYSANQQSLVTEYNEVNYQSEKNSIFHCSRIVSNNILRNIEYECKV